MKAHYAGFWIRFLAHIIDSVLLTVASWLLQGILFVIIYGIWKFMAAGGEIALPAIQDAFDPVFVQVFNVGIYLCLAFPYYVWGHFKHGTTVGKKPFRIRVVSQADLGPITLKQSIWRCIGYLPSYAVLLCGFLMASFHPEKRALHDLLAGTVSVRSEL